MTVSYRLLLFDLDGTLLTPERSIRPANVALFAELMASGIRVGLATGRAPRSALPHARQAGVNGPLVLFNGSMVWDVARAQAMYQKSLPLEDALAVMEIALEHRVHVNTYMDDEIWIAGVTDTSRRSELKDGVPHRVMDDLVERVRAGGRAPVKLMLIDEDQPVMGLEAEIREVLQSECTLVNSEPSYLEIMAPGVNKGSALVEIHREYGIAPGEVIGFGDQHNDRELMVTCGLGVAMGNAHPAIKGLADIIIGDNASDAIAEFLRDGFEVVGDRLVRG